MLQIPSFSGFVLLSRPKKKYLPSLENLGLLSSAFVLIKLPILFAFVHPVAVFFAVKISSPPTPPVASDELNTK